MNKIVIIGCGYIGQRVGKLWQQRGGSVTALARSRETASRLEALGFQVIPGDLDDAASLNGLALESALVYYFAPPPASAVEDTRMGHFLDALSERNKPERIVYISTSGVYGDSGGAWLNEESPVAPANDRSRRRLHAEQNLRRFASNIPIIAVILRVPGIYGPGKLPLDIIKSGRPMLKESRCGFTNRIHADDLARVCVAAGEVPNPSPVYNVSDGRPGTMAEYFKAVAEFAGLPRSPEVEWKEAQKLLSEGMLSYLRESRRIDNGKMLRELGVKLLYPDLQSGLAAIKAAATDDPNGQ